MIHSDGRGLVTELAFARGARIEPHANPNTTWLIVIEGGGWVGVGEERTRVAAGEAALWPADIPHAAWTEHSEMRAIVVEFGGADDADVLGLIEGRARELLPGEIDPPRVPRAADRSGPPPPHDPRRASRPDRRPRRQGEPAPDARRSRSTRMDRPADVTRACAVGAPAGRVEELEEVVDLVGRRQALGLDRRDPGDPREVERSDPATLAQDLGRRRDDRVEAEVRSAIERPSELLDPEVARQVARPSVVGIGPAQPDGRQPIPVPTSSRKRTRVQRGDRVAGADRAGVDLSSVNRSVVDGAVLVSDEPVGLARGPGRTRPGRGRRGRRSGASRSGHRRRADAPRRAVDVGVEAVALIGELLEQDVVVVAHPDADRDELDAGLGVIADRPRMPRVRSGRRSRHRPTQHDTVDAVLAERLAGQLVAEPQARLEVRRAAWSQCVDDPRISVARGARVGPSRTRASSPNVTIATGSPGRAHPRAAAGNP